MLRKIILILLVTTVCQAKPFLSFSGEGGDMFHFTGSALGTLAIQKAFNSEWHTAAAMCFTIGFMWEVGDEFLGKKYKMFDPKGFSEKDLLRNCLGIAFSYVLSDEWRITKNGISFRMKF